MIRFSKRGDYAVIIINELVKHFGKQLIPLSHIAKTHKLSPFFLRNVATDLRRAGLIDAIEGKNGGYKLNRPPKFIYAGEIIHAVSKHPIYSCCQKTKDGKCIAKSCPHGFSLRRLNNEFIEQVSGMTLDKLIDRE